MNYRRCILFGIVLMFAGALFAEETMTIDHPEQPDAREIVNRVAENWKRNLDLAQDYTYQARQVIQFLDKNGKVTGTKTETHEFSIIFGKQYKKLIARDDMPLSAKEQKKEEEKLNKFFKKRKRMSDKDRAKEMEKREREFKREIGDEFPYMLHFEIIGDEMLDGRPVWVIRAEPKTGYKSNSRFGSLFSKLSGVIWVDKADCEWVKLDTSVADDFNFAWLLLRLHKGARIEAEEALINDEIWLPKRALIEGSMRVAWAVQRVRAEVTFSQYQKFATDVNIMYE